jgi:hypothetical protein
MGAGGVGDVRGAGAHEAVVGVGVEPGGSPAECGGSVTVKVGDAFDQSVEAEPAQVVGHAPRTELSRAQSKERGQMVS